MAGQWTNVSKSNFQPSMRKLMRFAIMEEMIKKLLDDQTKPTTSEKFLRSGFLPSSLRPSAHKEPSRFPSQLLFLPQLTCTIKKSLHLSSHASKPRGKPKQNSISLSKLFRSNNWNILVLRGHLHHLKYFMRKSFRHAIKESLNTIDSIHPLLYPSRQALHVSIHGVEHDKDLQLNLRRRGSSVICRLNFNTPLFNSNWCILHIARRVLRAHCRRPLLARHATRSFPHIFCSNRLKTEPKVPSQIWKRNQNAQFPEIWAIMTSVLSPLELVKGLPSSPNPAASRYRFSRNSSWEFEEPMDRFSYAARHVVFTHYMKRDLRLVIQESLKGRAPQPTNFHRLTAAIKLSPSIVTIGHFTDCLYIEALPPDCNPVKPDMSSDCRLRTSAA
ncbi:hypothetical protein M5K25_018200 [Dendrobium thyrsiflorum]|uniref:Uncharacterized protein n=1 Tax=Dendrobium thyrsiflorum TaxID=117978 RepID=A0ABD0UPV7_DENTH